MPMFLHYLCCHYVIYCTLRIVWGLESLLDKFLSASSGKYEGYPMNMLLNGIIMLIFRISEIQDVHYVGNKTHSWNSII